MATVHPSRMGLVPHDAPDPQDSYHRSSRDQSPERSNSRARRSSSRDRRSGRRSPQYEEYDRPSSGSLPWRVEENMYPSGRGRTSYGRGGSLDFLTSRQRERESRTVNVWPSSPPPPSRELSPATRGSKTNKRSRKHERSPSTSSSDSSSAEERRRRREKERKRAGGKKGKEREERREKRRRRHDSSTDDDDDEDDRRRPRRSRGASKERRRATRSPSSTKSASMDEDEWVEKAPAPNSYIPLATSPIVEKPHMAAPAAVADDDDFEVGPQPPKAASTSKVDERSYGGALLRGEGSAMAAFLMDDVNARIPRRGEIGLTSQEIADFEAAGYVMSGSRHKRMNAVRMRKENQVISAEEKRGILKLQKEERERREEILREEFKEIVKERLSAGGQGK